MEMYRSRKGQGWTIDYTLSLLIFIIAGILAFKLVTNSFQDDRFRQVRQQAELVSEHLLSQGNPELWTPSNVVRIGLAESKNRLSEAKVENYQELDYSFTRNRFGILDEYAFYFKDRNGTILGMGDGCVLGSDEITEDKDLVKELQPAGYYYKDDSFMSGWMTTLNATFHDASDDSQVNEFYNELENYEFVMMENPEIEEGGGLSKLRKREELNEYVENGGLLFMSEDLGMNLTGISFKNVSDNDGQVVDDDDELLSMTTGTNIEDDNTVDTSYTVASAGASGFTNLTAYQNTRDPWIARWNYGLGTAYYFATIDATYKGAVDEDMSTKVGNAAENAVNETVADCNSIGTDNIDATNIAKVERLAIKDHEIVRMVVLAWN